MKAAEHIPFRVHQRVYTSYRICNRYVTYVSAQHRPVHDQLDQRGSFFLCTSWMQTAQASKRGAQDKGKGKVKVNMTCPAKGTLPVGGGDQLVLIVMHTAQASK